ncbi:DUF1217 domain-containing protein [Rhodovarius crocodyli]|uniref:DUF1217 domain-containing protein n=1 Tax=Rhodovarius crocodyli TaxID=1979269 RepID=A0A437MDD5_9PROT|nr:DUF1217 domain-containing protein [Rhodovarius crocodyli]RVT95662.1 DUF1217 domain-containing protein [Rhodovarius crocodyli]
MSGSYAGSTNPILAYRLNIKDGAEAKALARVAKEPDVQRSMDQFTKAVAQAKDIKSALKDPRILGVLMTAMGLGDATNQSGLATRALLSDLSDTKSLANNLSDSRWKNAAKSLDLFSKGLDALKDPKLQATLKEGLQRAKWYEKLDGDVAGLSDALAFKDKASTATDVYTVLGDPILRRVVTGALGLPTTIAIQSVETQARAVSSRLNLEKLQSPKEVQKLIERYLTNKDQTATNTSTNLLAQFGFTV